jgi:glycosyltransferase involved in cell wall biosynthesis
MKKKLIRITTHPLSISSLLQGQLKFMSNHFEVVGVSSNFKNYLELVSKIEGVPIMAVEMTRKITPFKDLKAVWQLYKLFKKEKPYIVHSHTPKAGTVSMIAAKIARIPHRLHTIAGLPLTEATGAKRMLLNIVEKLTYSCATMIYPNSFGLQDIILENKFTTKNKLKVIANGSSNGIDTEYFNPKFHENKDKKNKLRRDLKIANEDFVYVYMGRLVTDKGINELVSAFNTLCNNHSAIKLLLVGSYENELDPLHPKTLLGIENNKNIISTGWVDDVRPYLSISNALTFPSYREGFPNVVMQAGAMELPCIVTNINGCNEIIQQNISGLIIPVKDTQALYDAMGFVLRNISESINMGITCRAYIVANFERKVVWEALLDEYNKLN